MAILRRPIAPRLGKTPNAPKTPILRRPSTPPAVYDFCGSSSDIELSSPVQQVAKRTLQHDDAASAHRLKSGAGEGKEEGRGDEVMRDMSVAASDAGLGARPGGLPDVNNNVSSTRPIPSPTTAGNIVLKARPGPRRNQQYYLKPTASRSPKRIKTTNEHPSLKALDRTTQPYVKPMSTDDGDQAPAVRSAIPTTTTHGDVIQDSLNTVTKVIVDLGQKLKDTEQGLKEAQDELCRLEREKVAERQLQKVSNARILRLEQELQSEKAKCSILEDAQRKLDQIQALCGGLVMSGGAGLKREEGK
ncbi:hypothetical protein NX059_008417 [Plenodomus lindquistii]|nr:hypothetical protein NX059_008417 [Plenodomus lindquistii]